jgi:hypothetical protein
MLDSNSHTCKVTATLDHDGLRQENRAFRGTAGVSATCRGGGFIPAFLDRETGRVYVSRLADGQPAPFHTLEGLPDEVVVKREASGRVIRVKHSLISGFEKSGVFYTREDVVACATVDKQ